MTYYNFVVVILMKHTLPLSLQNKDCKWLRLNIYNSYNRNNINIKEDKLAGRQIYRLILYSIDNQMNNITGCPI